MYRFKISNRLLLSSRMLSDAGKAVNAMYANLREWTNIAFAPIAVESMGSDDAEKGSSS